MNASRRTIVLIVGIFSVPIVLGLCAWIAFVIQCTAVYASDFYGPFEFNGSEGTYFMGSTFSPESTEIYFAVGENQADGERKLVSLRQITEQMLLDAGFDRSESNGGFYDTIFDGQGALFKFDQGKMTAMHFSGDGLPFSNRIEGPRLTFPVEYERLHAVFGKPDAVHHRRETRPIRWH